MHKITATRKLQESVVLVLRIKECYTLSNYLCVYGVCGYCECPMYFINILFPPINFSLSPGLSDGDIIMLIVFGLFSLFVIIAVTVVILIVSTKGECITYTVY